MLDPLVMPGKGDIISSGAIVYPFEFTTMPFKMTTFEVLQDCVTPQDEHKVEEIWVVQSGMGELTYENNNYIISPGQVFYFAAFKKHQVKNIGLETLKILSLYW